MKRDDRLSNTLHALLHMADHQAATGAPMTSERLAACLGTNPVVVRRTMAGLRDMGLVTSGRGHGGGWRLARDLKEVTLLKVAEALGETTLLATPKLVDHDGCLVEAAVTDALAGAHAAANALLVARLGEVTLADLADDFRRRMAAHPHKGINHGKHHAS
ncbi:MAG: transcriptional regulator [Caulobacteraceae bacterium]|nr:transcriptional regulator [Caulobacteraceae bacterium]